MSVTLPDEIARHVLNLSQLDRKTDTEVRAMYPDSPLCKAPLHTPTTESLSLNSLVQVIISSLSYRDSIGEREERVCKSLLHIVASVNGCEVVKYLCQQGCVSNLEISRALSISRQAVMWHLDTLENLGLLRVYATVENEIRIPAQFRGAKIRGWVGLPPEYSEHAIQRYLAFFKKGKTESIEPNEEDTKKRTREDTHMVEVRAYFYYWLWLAEPAPPAHPDLYVDLRRYIENHGLPFEESKQLANTIPREDIQNKLKTDPGRVRVLMETAWEVKLPFRWGE